MRGTCVSRAIIDLKAIPSSPLYFAARPVPLRHSPPLLLFPLSTLVLARRFIRIVAISEALFQKKCPHSPRRTEEQETEGEREGGRERMEAKAVSRVEKYFSRRLRARPLRTSPILPFVLFHPFGGRSPPMCLRFS